MSGGEWALLTLPARPCRSASGTSTMAPWRRRSRSLRKKKGWKVRSLGVPGWGWGAWPADPLFTPACLA